MGCSAVDVAEETKGRVDVIGDSPYESAKDQGFWNAIPWVQILALPLVPSGASGKLLNPSGP